MMRDESVKRDYFWIVEAVDYRGQVLYNGTFANFDKAWEKYHSFKNLDRKATVSLQRRYKEYKVA